MSKLIPEIQQVIEQVLARHQQKEKARRQFTRFLENLVKDDVDPADVDNLIEVLEVQLATSD